MSKKISYAGVGVDRELRAESKKSLKRLKRTYEFSAYGEVLQLPYGNIFPLGDRYLDLAIEGVGTKVLLAQLAEKHDTIGIDGVAMVVNDVIRSGAQPLALADNIHAQVSDPALVKEWLKGLAKGAGKSECLVAGGEIGDVFDVIKGVKEGKGFDLVVACIGEVKKGHVITGDKILSGDIVIGIRSSGIHSNGITLARKILFKEWGGKFDPYDIPDGFDRDLIFEVLEPTRIYVKPIKIVNEEYQIKGAVHITGDAYLKFRRLTEFSKGVGFEFTNFKPHPVFQLIQEIATTSGGISDEEMFKTFNMGWGFAVVVSECDEDDVLGVFDKVGFEAEVIGNVTDTGRIVAFHEDKKLMLN